MRYDICSHCLRVVFYLLRYLYSLINIETNLSGFNSVLERTSSNNTGPVIPRHYRLSLEVLGLLKSVNLLLKHHPFKVDFIEKHYVDCWNISSCFHTSYLRYYCKAHLNDPCKQRYINIIIIIIINITIYHHHYLPSTYPPIPNHLQSLSPPFNTSFVLNSITEDVHNEKVTRIRRPLAVVVESETVIVLYWSGSETMIRVLITFGNMLFLIKLRFLVGVSQHDVYISLTSSVRFRSHFQPEPCLSF